MANLTPSDSWDDVYEIDGTDPVRFDIPNASNQNLLNRTERIKETLNLAGIDVENESVDGIILPIDTLSDLEAYTGDAKVIYLKGRVSDGDGGEGIFVWSDSDLSAEVAADTLHGIYVPFSSAPLGTSGGWVRQDTDKIWSSWFGGDANAIQAALDVPRPKTVYVDKNVSCANALTIDVDYTTVVFANGVTLTSAITPSAITDGFITISAENVRLENINLDGDDRAHSGIVVLESSKVRFMGGKLENFSVSGADCINVGHGGSVVSDVIVDSVKFYDSQTGIRVNGSVGSVVGAVVQNCRFIGNAARDIEFVADDGVIRDNYIETGGIAGLYIAGGSTAAWGKVQAIGNTIIGVSGAPRMGVKISTGTTSFKLADNYIDVSLGSSDASYCGILLQGASDGVIENNTVIGGLNQAIMVQPHPDPSGSDSSNLTIQNNSFSSDNAVCASYTDTAAGGYIGSGYKFLNNIFSGMYTTGISGTADDVEIMNNDFKGSASCQNMIRLFGSELNITGNTFRDSSRSAILIENLSTKDALNIRITNNNILTSTYSGGIYGRIQVVSDPADGYVLKNTFISGNTIVGGRHGILLGTSAVSDDSENTVVTNNTISDTVLDAIYCKASGAKISHNTLKDYSSGSSNYSGIKLDGDSNTVLSNSFESATKYRHINVASGTGNRLVYNFMDTDSIIDSGTSTYSIGNVFP